MIMRILCIPFVLTYGGLASADPIHEGEFVDYFMDVASDFPNGSPASDLVTKWDRTVVNVAVIFEKHHASIVDDDLIPALKSVREGVFEETGFFYRFPQKITDEEPADVFLMFGTPDELAALTGQLEDRVPFGGIEDMVIDQWGGATSVCAVALNWGESREIVSVAIAIDSRMNIPSCVNEVLFSSMGFMGHSDRPPEQDETDRQITGGLNDRQRLALRVLYSEDLKVGSELSVSEIHEIVDMIKEEN